MKTKRIVTPFHAVDVTGNEYELESIEIVLIHNPPHSGPTDIPGTIDFQTKEGLPVIALGYDNYEIIGDDNSRTQVIKMKRINDISAQVSTVEM